MPIAYQKIERDLRLFAAISSGATCIIFHDHFTVQCDNRSLRSNVKPKLVAPTFKRKIFLQSFFPRVSQLVNDLHDSTEIDLITPSHNFKDQLRLVTVTWPNTIWPNFFLESLGLKILSQVTTKLSQLHSNSRNK